MRGLCQGIFRQWLSREVFSIIPTLKWIVPTPGFLRAAVEQRHGPVLVLAGVLLWSSRAAKAGAFSGGSANHQPSKQTKEKTFTWNVKTESSTVKLWCSGFWGFKCLPSPPHAQIHPSWPSSKSGSHLAHPLLYPPLLMSRKHSAEPFTTSQLFKILLGLSLTNTSFSFSFFFNRSIVELQCFECTAKWFSYTHIYIYSFSDSLPL